jgi:hypothetical protein
MLHFVGHMSLSGAARLIDPNEVGDGAHSLIFITQTSSNVETSFNSSIVIIREWKNIE